MEDKPPVLYHGSTKKNGGSFTPMLLQSTEDHIHSKPAVFATEHAGIASLFMMPEDALFSIGYEQGIPYVCIWGTAEEFISKDRGGYLYLFSSDTFEKVGKEYEWQSFQPVEPREARHFSSVLDAFRETGVRIYFIQDDALFDMIQANKQTRLETLKNVQPWNPT
ncbi:MAG: hypothetical protein WC787_03810 [Patescibacteria group bacterium]|jgi:hypothetical protein